MREMGAPIQYETRMSSGKQPVLQPRSEAGRSNVVVKAPSVRSTVQAPHAHTSTAVQRPGQ